MLPRYWPERGGGRGVLGSKVKGRCKGVFGVSNSHFQDFLGLVVFGIVSSYQGFFWVLTKMGRFIVKVCYGPFQWTLSYKKIPSILETDLNLNIRPATQ